MKLMGSVCLIAGTAIGAGMMALPIALAKFGIILSAILMAVTWIVCYFSALLNLELNLMIGHGLPISALSKKFSGPKAYFLGGFSLLLLCYSLLSAYIYGGASTLNSLVPNLSKMQAPILYALALGIVMLFSMRNIDILNRFLFLGKISVTFLIIILVIFQIDFSNSPITIQTPLALNDFYAVAPIVFTSFGFQVIFHTIVNQGNNDPDYLKKAFFWGSFLPLIIYILWSTIICCLIYKNFPEVFQKMLFATAEVAEVISAISSLGESGLMQKINWAIGFFAIATSTLGVCVGLIDTLKSHNLQNHLLAVMLAIIPATIVATIIPNAFIKALAFAGMILSFMALLLPVYLLLRSNSVHKSYFYPILKNPLIIGLISGYGLFIIYSEVINLLK